MLWPISQEKRSPFWSVHNENNFESTKFDEIVFPIGGLLYFSCCADKSKMRKKFSFHHLFGPWPL